MNRTTTGWVLLTLILLWFPTVDTPSTAAWHMDLLVHMGLFWVLGGWSWPASPGGRVNLIRWAFLTVGIAVLGESGQLYIPGRSFQFLDLWINVAGIAAGGLWSRTLTGTLGRRHARRRTLLVGLALMAAGIVGSTARSTIFDAYVIHRPGLLWGGGLLAALGGSLWAITNGMRVWTVTAVAGLIVLVGLVPPWTSAGPGVIGGLLVILAHQAMRRAVAARLLPWLSAALVTLWWIAVLLPPDRFLRGGGGWMLLAVLVPFQVRLWHGWFEGTAGSR